MAVEKIWSSRNNNAEFTQFVGQEGEIFFNPVTGELRRSDGATPGGLPIGGFTAPATIFINEKDDFPAPVGGVITLLADKIYYVTADIDLTGDRLIVSSNTSLIGGSFNVSKIRSTGLAAGTALISGSGGLTMRDIELEHDLLFDLDGAGNSESLNWINVNLVNSPTLGTLANYSNFLGLNVGIINSENLTFDGVFNTIGFSDTLFLAADGGTLLNFPSTLTITRRMRITYSSFVVPVGATGINFDVGVTVPNNNYILDTVNFSGGGTYTAGVDFSDNKAEWSNCVGITNSSILGIAYAKNQVTATVINTVNVPVKANIDTTAGDQLQKFTHEANRLTYTGTIAGVFELSAILSFTGNNNRRIGMFFLKNGTLIEESEFYAYTGGGGRSGNNTLLWVEPLEENDYIEIWIENESDSSNVTVTDAVILIRPIG
jgi:hypothetical protein